MDRGLRNTTYRQAVSEGATPIASQAVFAVAEGLNVAPSSQFLECSGVESAIKGTGGLFVLRK